MQSNPTRAKARPQKPVVMWLLIAIAAATLVVFPPVRFHRLGAAGSSGAGGASAGGAASGTVAQPELAAKTFWDERLMPALRNAPDAKALLAAMRADPAAA